MSWARQALTKIFKLVSYLGNRTTRQYRAPLQGNIHILKSDPSICIFQCHYPQHHKHQYRYYAILWLIQLIFYSGPRLLFSASMETNRMWQTALRSWKNTMSPSMHQWWGFSCVEDHTSMTAAYFVSAHVTIWIDHPLRQPCHHLTLTWKIH